MYRLHFAPDNASLIVRLALEEMGLAYETRLVDRRRRAQDSAAYRRLNPAGLIPTLETPDGPIAETGAILLWLSDRHGALAPSVTGPARAAYLHWLFFTANTLHADIRLHFYPDRHAGSDACVPAFAAATRTRIARHLDILEGVAAQAPDWLGAAAPTGLGYYLACLLRWLALYPEGATNWFDLATWPTLARILAALETRPAGLAAARAEGLGQTIFTRPALAVPPVGSAT
ncbi:MAG: glutathione S-transferase family protein [Defluviimonas sp.]|uniref:glutathione S-transferase family protein n=1 Tax=Albidovulum sp. TaxID=1872424 RepID=UPI001D7EE28D|nr:glutathione S-transferase family protein [Paracoccaceae bacterium]MCC0063694.1 glutathione S-transferase family protein [Defluviimonas sp.]